MNHKQLAFDILKNYTFCVSNTPIRTIVNQVMQLLLLGKLNSEISKAIEIAQRKGAKVILAETKEECLSIILAGKSADLILVDVNFDIASIASSLEAEKISANIVAYGQGATPKEVVAAIKAGAKEFIPLPPDEELIAAIIESISGDEKKLIYKSESMGKVINIASKVSKSDAHVLITGESGTGKEVLAHFLHNNSNRSKGSFVRVNCAAIPENLIESELFGHEKGSFTGANNRRVGKFEESSGGTLLLDEISELDIKLQAKLLRAIQEKEIDIIGGSKPVRVDLRIVATSNRDLQYEIAKGTFREDLYFRLNVINLELPPLRQRKEDILDLAHFFIEKYCGSNKISIKTLEESAKELLISHSWPGNIRELENSIHRAVLLSNEEITRNDFNLQEKNTREPHGERGLILNTLNYCLGDMNHAANILGISIANLTKKLNSNI